MIVDSFSKTVQLGVGLEASGRLSRSSMGRTIQALRICEKKIEKHGVRRMRLVATEACRRARNASDFIRQVRRETGLALEIIAPEEEARLAVISCAPLVNADDRAASGGGYRRRVDRTGLDRPVRRGPGGPAARDHAAAHGVQRAGRGAGGAGGGLDFGAAWGWRR